MGLLSKFKHNNEPSAPDREIEQDKEDSSLNDLIVKDIGQQEDYKRYNNKRNDGDDE